PFQKREVGVSLSAAVTRIRERAVFVDAPYAHVRHADDDRFDALGREAFNHLVEPPRAGERARRIRQVLRILHVDDGIATPGARVRRGEIDVDVAHAVRRTHPGEDPHPLVAPWPASALRLHHSTARAGGGAVAWKSTANLRV